MNPSQYIQQKPFVNQTVSNLSTSHPVINNSNQYMYEQKFVSIHSEDRDCKKYPNSSEFDIDSIINNYTKITTFLLQLFM